MLVIPDEQAEQLAKMNVPMERLDLAVPSFHLDGPPLTLDDLIDLHQQLAAL